MSASEHPPSVEVVIEIPRGSFVKRGSSGRVDFVSPLPCPFNYGSVPTYLGLEGDYLDAIVLGPRRERDSRVRLSVFGAVGLSDHGSYDDKLVCAEHPPSRRQRILVVVFLHAYAALKRVLNLLRGRTGRTACEGWCDAGDALRRATPRLVGARRPRG